MQVNQLHYYYQCVQNVFTEFNCALFEYSVNIKVLQANRFGESNIGTSSRKKSRDTDKVENPQIHKIKGHVIEAMNEIHIHMQTQIHTSIRLLLDIS